MLREVLVAPKRRQRLQTPQVGGPVDDAGEEVEPGESRGVLVGDADGLFDKRAVEAEGGDLGEVELVAELLPLLSGTEGAHALLGEDRREEVEDKLGCRRGCLRNILEALVQSDFVVSRV